MDVGKDCYSGLTQEWLSGELKKIIALRTKYASVTNDCRLHHHWVVDARQFVEHFFEISKIVLELDDSDEEIAGEALRSVVCPNKDRGVEDDFH